jgi:hypothetical protein
VGSALGAMRTAAHRLGITADDYMRRVSSGEKWCTGCRAWHDLDSFGADSMQRDSHARICRQAARAHRKYLPTGRPRGLLPRPPDSERLWAHIEPEPTSGCWLWIGTRDARTGYGRVHDCRAGRASRMRLAHRVSWEVFNGREVPPGMCVCHACDTKLCVNPSHLFLGTLTDNNRDRDRKGRASSGQEHSAKIIAGLPQNRQRTP